MSAAKGVRKSGAAVMVPERTHLWDPVLMERGVDCSHVCEYGFTAYARRRAGCAEERDALRMCRRMRHVHCSRSEPEPSAGEDMGRAGGEWKGASVQAQSSKLTVRLDRVGLRLFGRSAYFADQIVAYGAAALAERRHHEHGQVAWDTTKKAHRILAPNRAA